MVTFRSSHPACESLCARPQGHPAALAYTLLWALMDEDAGSGPHTTLRLSSALALAIAQEEHPRTALLRWLLLGPLAEASPEARSHAQLLLADRILTDLGENEQ